MPLFNKFFWVTSVNHFQDFILITFSYWDGNCAKSLFNFPISEALRFLCLFCQSKLRKKVVSQSSRTFYLFPWDSQTWTWNFLHWLVITIRHADDTYSISWNEVTSIGHDASRKKIILMESLGNTYYELPMAILVQISAVKCTSGDKGVRIIQYANVFGWNGTLFLMFHLKMISF